MAQLQPGRFNIDQSLELAADGYQAILPNSDEFRNKATTDQDINKIKLSTGFKNPGSDTVFKVGALDGVIDSYSLDIDNVGVAQCSIKGRDNMAVLLDRQYRKLFLKKKPTTTDNALPVMGEDTINGVPYLVGDYRASDIAKMICAAFDLQCSWECRDYVMVEDFDAVGKPVEISRARPLRTRE